MKRFVIRYTFSLDSSELDAWHRRVREFITAIDAAPSLKGKIRYRCMRVKDTMDYMHFVEADDDAPNLLQQEPFFKPYTEETKRVAGGTVTVSPLEMIADTT